MPTGYPTYFSEILYDFLVGLNLQSRKITIAGDFKFGGVDWNGSEGITHGPINVFVQRFVVLYIFCIWSSVSPNPPFFPLLFPSQC